MSLLVFTADVLFLSFYITYNIIMSSVAYKSLVITDTTASTSTSTGALVCSGGIGISGAITVGGNITSTGTITGNTVSTPNTFTVTDGANTGTIDQVSTELTLSSSGNKVAIASGNTLEFKNDGTRQLSAYTGREIVDDCDLFTSLWNSINPSNLIYALSSTFAMNQAVPTTLAVTVNTIYAYPVRLIKGQVVNGAGFYLNVSGSPQIAYALYSTANPGVRLASTATTTATSGVKLINFTSSYTVPTTGIYYICLYASNIGTSLSMIALASNTYIHYSQLILMTNGVLDKAAQSVSTAGGFPSNLSSLMFTALNRVSYAVVYSLSPS
jgi:cytoskeletal protein CcmA (bactofilin family)